MVLPKNPYLSELKQYTITYYKQTKAVYKYSPFISVAADVSSPANEETVLGTMVRRDAGEAIRVDPEAATSTVHTKKNRPKK